MRNFWKIGILFGVILAAATTTQIPLLRSTSSIDSKDTKIFYPGQWKLESWITVDDRIRGGKSISKLAETSGKNVIFSGSLDTTALGGAGFASQQFWFEKPLDFNGYNSLIVRLTGNQKEEKMISINLYNDYPSDRGDGRNKSQVVYKASFWPICESCSLLWSSFSPTYRGRDKPDEAPLDLTRITGISIMMQSFFNEQHGDFSIEFESIELN